MTWESFLTLWQRNQKLMLWLLSKRRKYGILRSKAFWVNLLWSSLSRELPVSRSAGLQKPCSKCWRTTKYSLPFTTSSKTSIWDIGWETIADGLLIPRSTAKENLLEVLMCANSLSPKDNFWPFSPKAAEWLVLKKSTKLWSKSTSSSYLWTGLALNPRKMRRLSISSVRSIIKRTHTCTTYLLMRPWRIMWQKLTIKNFRFWLKEAKWDSCDLYRIIILRTS